jgi:hypothetical protein
MRYAAAVVPDITEHQRPGACRLDEQMKTAIIIIAAIVLIGCNQASVAGAGDKAISQTDWHAITIDGDSVRQVGDIYAVLMMRPVFFAGATRLVLPLVRATKDTIFCNMMGSEFKIIMDAATLDISFP